MNFKEFGKWTIRKDIASYPNINLNRLKLLHDAIGIVGEAGEVSEIIKKHVFKGKPLDKDHLKEEISDTIHYIARLCDRMDFDLDDIMAQNISKIEERHK